MAFRFGRVHVHFGISRSFGIIAKVPVHFVFLATQRTIRTSIARNVQPHVTDSTAMDNKWLVKAAQKHRSVSNRTFALHTRFNLRIPKLLRPI